MCGFATVDLCIHSDPLAFQWLSKYPDKCRNVTFVDIDYPELITRKLEVISQTPQLRDLLDAPVPIGGRDGAPPPVNIRYLALGCDLADIERLEKILNENIDIESCSILCVAEVSITYMDVGDADSLIRWASRYRDSIYDAPRYVYTPNTQADMR